MKIKLSFWQPQNMVITTVIICPDGGDDSAEEGGRPKNYRGQGRRDDAEVPLRFRIFSSYCNNTYSTAGSFRPERTSVLLRQVGAAIWLRSSFSIAVFMFWMYPVAWT